MKKILASALSIGLLTGCVGYNFPPNIWENKPFTLINTGDQLGRDQMANRFLVAQHLIPMSGRNSNEVLTILGQPQEIQIIERDISEDWYYIYHRPKSIKQPFSTGKDAFLVRFYHDHTALLQLDNHKRR